MTRPRCQSTMFNVKKCIEIISRPRLHRCPKLTFNAGGCVFGSSFVVHFAELRKQACQLENEIDLKLVSFSKLGTNYRSVREYSPFQSIAHRSPYK